MLKSATTDSGEHLKRVRQICRAFPDTTEKLSHGEPTFFVRKKVYVMFAGNHHADGRIAVWLPVPPGEQELLLNNLPEVCFYPPYVGVRGWIGIDLELVNDEVLAFHIQQAWRMIAGKQSCLR